MRKFLANVFIAFPLMCLIKVMALVRTPVLFCLKPFPKAANRVADWYAITGLKIYFFVVRAVEGREAAEMALLQILMQHMSEGMQDACCADEP